MKTYNVLDIARYVINYCNDNNFHISNLKLQKILYFIQAGFYLNKGNECFKENIEAWKYGPVIPEVYHEFKQYGSTNIPYISEYMDFSGGIFNCKSVRYNEDIIDDADKIIINELINNCNKYTASQLVDITHKQKPWIDSYVNGINNVIDKSTLQKYFKGK